MLKTELLVKHYSFSQFLVLTALETNIFCREKFSEEQRMIASSAEDFAKEQLKPISEKLNTVLDEELTIGLIEKLRNHFEEEHGLDYTIEAVTQMITNRGHSLESIKK